MYGIPCQCVAVVNMFMFTFMWGINKIDIDYLPTTHWQCLFCTCWRSCMWHEWNRNKTTILHERKLKINQNVERRSRQWRWVWSSVPKPKTFPVSSVLESKHVTNYLKIEVKEIPIQFSFVSLQPCLVLPAGVPGTPQAMFHFDEMVQRLIFCFVWTSG